MTDEMVEKVASLSETALAKALAYVEATEGFVVEQAPLLVQEILNYGLFCSSFWTVFWAAACGGVVWVGIKAWKLMEADNEDPILAFLLLLIGGGGTAAGFCLNLFSAAKIVFAPRLYLLEKFSELM